MYLSKVTLKILYKSLKGNNDFFCGNLDSVKETVGVISDDPQFEKRVILPMNFLIMKSVKFSQFSSYQIRKSLFKKKYN